MQRFFIYAVLLAGILLSCDMQKLIEPQPYRTLYKTPIAYKNPHTPCVDCHTTKNPRSGAALFVPGTDPSALCLNCHDYQENHHPVDFVPVDPAGIPLPLFEGKIKCLTCHEIHGGSGHEGTPKLLRGGPYADRRAICFKCHARERYAAIDPHKMLDNEGNIVEVNGKPVCLLCHSIKPDPAVDTTNEVGFRADVGFLCWRCHPPMPGSFFDKHFLVRPSEQTLQYMHETEERLLVIFPLVPRGRITCSTCHNPHQEGVMRREVAAKGSDAVSKLRLPSICFACHRM